MRGVVFASLSTPTLVTLGFSEDQALEIDRARGLLTESAPLPPPTSSTISSSSTVSKGNEGASE